MALKGSALMSEQLREWADELPNLPGEYREMLRSVASGGPALEASCLSSPPFQAGRVWDRRNARGAIGVAVFEKRKIGRRARMRAALRTSAGYSCSAATAPSAA